MEDHCEALRAQLRASLVIDNDVKDGSLRLEVIKVDRKNCLQKIISIKAANEAVVESGILGPLLTRNYQ